MMQKIIGERIRLLRIQRTNLSQEDFARLIGVDRTYMCRLENGKKNPTLETLNKVCVGIGISLKEFFDFESPVVKVGD